MAREKKFELFMGCLGNGITVCNKAVMEHGDYKQIAHISDAGNIKFYVPVDYIPGKDLLRIEHDADAMRENTKKRIGGEVRTERGYWRIWEDVMDCLPISQYLEFSDTLKTTDDMDEKREMLISKYLETH